jgi:hypothetical protein
LAEESVRKSGSPPDLPGLREPADYLGSAETFRLRLLEEIPLEEEE